MPQVFLLRFKTPYVVNTSNPSSIIDSFTVLRALANIAIASGLEELSSRISKGELAASSILPAIRAEKCFRLLAPVSALPLVPEKTRKILAFAPLHVIKEALLDYSRHGAESFPVQVGIKKNGGREVVEIRYGDVAKEYPRELFKRVSEAYEGIDETRARIDRVTLSSDLYRVRAVMPLTEMWVAFSDSVPYESLRQALRLLGMIGIGALKSRGMGKFEVVDGEFCRDDGEAIVDPSIISRDFKEGPVMLLGMYPSKEPFDPELSIVAPSLVYGIGGPSHMEYKMPFIVAAGVGSVAWLKKPLNPVIEVIEAIEGFKPLLIFNPMVVMHGS